MGGMNTSGTTPPLDSMTDAAMSIAAVTKRYGNVRAVDEVSLEVPRGQILALLGRNGAGKSTLMELMLGLAVPQQGSVTIAGVSPTAATRGGAIGAMLQDGALMYEQSVKTNLRMLHGLHAHPRPLDEVVAIAGLEPLLKSRVDKLSGGQTQRLRFAIALLGDPQILLLDEPTAGMDVESRLEFWERIRTVAAQGVTIVFATHYLEEAEREAERIVVMHRGRVVADGDRAAMTSLINGRTLTVQGISPATLEALPGVAHAWSESGETRALCPDADAVLRTLMTAPEFSGVHDVRVADPTLEEAFLIMTGENS